jgi:hypothetical protein
MLRAMALRSSVFSCVAAAWVWAALPDFAVRAAEPWPSTGLHESAAEKAIAAALCKPVRLEFVETPLEDVLAFLRDQSRIPIEIDKKALDNVGVGTDTPLTKNLKDVSLRSALRLLLEDLDLTFVVNHEVLLVTSREKADANFQVRIYSVAALLRDGSEIQELAAMLRQALDFEVPAPIAVGFAVAMQAVPNSGGEEAGAAACPAGETAGCLAAPAAPSPRRLIPYQKLLVVRDTDQGHEAVANLLGALAESLKKEDAK